MIAKILLKTAFQGKIHLIYVFRLKGILLLLFLNLLWPKNKTAVAVPLRVNYKKNFLVYSEESLRNFVGVDWEHRGQRETDATPWYPRYSLYRNFSPFLSRMCQGGNIHPPRDKINSKRLLASALLHTLASPRCLRRLQISLTLSSGCKAIHTRETFK